MELVAKQGIFKSVRYMRDIIRTSQVFSVCKITTREVFELMQQFGSHHAQCNSQSLPIVGHEHGNAIVGHGEKLSICAM